MTGLDKIINHIAGEANSEADGIISAAGAQAEEIIAEAKAEAESRCAGIVGKAREEASLIDHIASSGAELEARNRRLAARQKAISDVLSDAESRLCRLPDEQYFAVMIQLARRYCQRGKGELLLSRRDKSRLPADFMKKLNEKIAGKFASLTLADDTVSFGGGPETGGFILRYGGVEENCSFSALIEQQREQLSDKLSDLLFS